MNLVDAALAFHDHGCCVVPVRNDGTKTPAGPWKHRQTSRPTRDDVAQLATTHDGIGLICGAVSNNLELFELEGRAIHDGLVQALAKRFADHGHTHLWERLCAGYLEQTPAYGLHWLYHVDGPPRPNLKLARRPATPQELETNPHDRIKVLAETRGEGGFVVVAPTRGTCHPTGRPWTLLAGGPATIPTLTVDERDTLHALAAMLDQMPPENPWPTSSNASSAPGQGTGQAPTQQGTGTPAAAAARPGDDYNQRATWEEILTPAGWTRTRTFNPNAHGWTRPGKHPRDGISATTGTSNDGADRLYVFTTATEFADQKPYTKFAAYTHLHHGGDYAAAARTLRAQGYGAPLEPTRPIDITELIADDPQPETSGPHTTHVGGEAPSSEGNLATVTQLRPRAATTLERSEDGHAQALIDRYGPHIRYCPGRNRWLAWGGHVWEWQVENGGILREHAKAIARELPETDAAALTHKRKALSAAGTSGALRQACTDPRVTVDITALDANPWALNTPGGTVDLRTGTIRPCDPTELHTRHTAVTPDFDAASDTFNTFLDDTFNDDIELRVYVQRLIGVALIGAVLEQILPFWFGPGANGKSTLLEAIMYALRTGDTGYAMAAPAEMLMVRKHSEHPVELAQMAGTRLVVCSELEDGQRLAEARVKHLTGRDSINARFLYGQPFTFTPSHTIILAGNHKPVARVGGQGLWRRLKAVPFPHVVPKERRDPALGDKLANAAPAVLAWAIRGAADYQRHGLTDPVAVQKATRDYEADQDTVGRFVADRCHLAASDAVKVATTVLRSDYENWCRETGDEPVSAKRLGLELRDRFGVRSLQEGGGRRFYVGITVLGEETSESGWV